MGWLVGGQTHSSRRRGGGGSGAETHRAEEAEQETTGTKIGSHGQQMAKGLARCRHSSFGPNEASDASSDVIPPTSVGALRHAEVDYSGGTFQGCAGPKVHSFTAVVDESQVRRSEINVLEPLVNQRLS